MMRILIATGVEEISEDAVRLGIQLAETAQCEASIISVIEDEHDAPEVHADLVRALSSLGLTINEGDVMVAAGERAAEIVREAKAGEYDLLVIGSTSSHNFLERILGSPGDRILTHSPCPVLIAKGKAKVFKRILLCSSGANGYQGPSTSLIRLAPLLSSKNVTVLHVMSQISAMPAVPEGWQLQADARELMEEDTPEGRLLNDRVRMLQKSGFQAQARVRHGIVVDEILGEAESGNYDLLVIGAHGTTGWRRYLLEDVAHQIIIQADRPVLVA